MPFQTDGLETKAISERNGLYGAFEGARGHLNIEALPEQGSNPISRDDSHVYVAES